MGRTSKQIQKQNGLTPMPASTSGKTMTPRELVRIVQRLVLRLVQRKPEMITHKLAGTSLPWSRNIQRETPRSILRVCPDFFRMKYLFWMRLSCSRIRSCVRAFLRAAFSLASDYVQHASLLAVRPAIVAAAKRDHCLVLNYSAQMHNRK
eukprot:COSAG05_NODE_6376_length_970_cov_1.709529_2_plen_150_part_00